MSVAAPTARNRPAPSDIWRRASGWLLPVAFAAFVGVGLCGNVLAPADPAFVDLANRYIPPFVQAAHPLGTDQLGRDILSRALVGANLSLSIAALSILVASTWGIAVGMIAGYFGGAAEIVLMRLADAMLSLPTIMIALLLVAIMEPGFWSVVAAVVMVTWARYARFIRGEVVAIRSREFLSAAVVCGTPAWKILWHHVLPNVLNAVVVLLTLDIGRVILLESSLAFLGLGLPPDRGAWGSTIFEGKVYLEIAPWIVLVPSAAMTVAVLLANSFGNWLSDRLDPRLRALER